MAWPAAAPPNAWAPVPSAPAAWTPQPPWQPVGFPPPMALRPVQGLAGSLVVLVAIVVGWAALNLALMAMFADWGSPFATGPVAAAEQLVSVVAAGLSIAAIVVFCMWLYRVMANARQRHPAVGISPGWAVGSFFIPIVHLFAPYFAIRRAWQADVSQDEGALTAWFLPWSLSTLLGYVAGTLVAVIAFQAMFEADIDDLWDDLRPVQIAVGAVSLVLQAISAFFLVRVVRRWTALQEGPPVS
jgi:hypothetical protein